MDYPTGRECTEGDCQWFAPKHNTSGSNRSIADYECIGKEKYWPDCPRAIRELVARVRPKKVT